MITPGGSPVLLEQKHVAFDPPGGEKTVWAGRGRVQGKDAALGPVSTAYSQILVFCT